MKLITFLSIISLTFQLLYGAHVVPKAPTCNNCQCTTCVGKELLQDGNYRVQVSTSNCKSDGVISWVCCRDCVELSSCVSGTAAYDKQKCENSAGAYYIVSPTTTSLVLNVHDGTFAGNSFDTTCGGVNGACGSGSCITTISLDTCPDVSIDECTTDDDCLVPEDQLCATNTCVDGVCTPGFKDSDFVCRESSGDCDSSEYCDGFTGHCPDDGVKDTQYECRVADGDCDAPEYCDGVTKVCPTDLVKDNTVVCRTVTDVCDVEEKCNGVTKDCPVDQVKGNTEVCRPLQGVCDVEEKCDGANKNCPVDAVKDSTEVCRAAKDKCDYPEYCDGTSVTCSAPDSFRSLGYTYKCGTTQFLCDVKENELTKNNGNAFFLGQCGIGTAREFITLPWPSCVNQCINTMCPNYKKLSNYATGLCNGNTGKFDCTRKVDVKDTSVDYCIVL